ncbi:MAG: trypsin-like peptidase domain-containing protein [Thermoleophilia bacterium]|nr:trypsin-like peptidase domain-containing protein [Thermoleophilia bacterium]
MRLPRTGLLTLGAALVAAVVGGAVALAGAALLVGFEDDDGAAPFAVVDSRIEAPERFSRGRPLSIGQVYERTRPGVVQVSTRTIAVEPQDPFGFFSGPPEQQGLGSGFVIDKTGHIVTNFHVVDRADEIRVSFSNNESVKATVVGTDPSTDLAVLKVATDSRALTPLVLGNSDSVRVGDEVVAIGNPLGYQRTVTSGIVSAVGRSIQAPDQRLIDQAIQTDAAINQGNSGGPLLDAAGRVIGVNTQIATQTGGNVGLGFAVPINTVKDVAAQLIAKGKVEHAALGIYAQPITEEIAELFRLPVDKGLLVTEVFEGSGAERAGLRAGTKRVQVEGFEYVIGGDIIVEADGRPVSSVEELRRAISRKEPGDSMELEIYRDDERQTLDVKLGRQSPSPRG